MKAPVVQEVKLQRDYPFQYENFVLATQHDIYLLLAKEGTLISGLRFRSNVLKYGVPNDEARGSHPLVKHGLGLYGLYQVKNSPWICELIEANRIHPRHADSMFADRMHFIACFKDVMLEVVCHNFEEVQLEEEQLIAIFQEQMSCLE